MVSLVGAAAAAPQAQTPQMPPQNPLWPNSYYALGDSYAAGIGAGKYYMPDEPDNKKCKRFAKSYPALTRDTTIFRPVIDAGFRFVACSGNVLDDIDRQRNGLGKGEVVSLSISGNDFNFASVVEACVYTVTGSDKACDDALTAAEAKVNDATIWAKYTTKVQDILTNNLADDAGGMLWSVLLISGYPKFWATPKAGDVCSNNGFPILLVSGPKLRVIVRSRMNNAVNSVNTKIKEMIAAVNPRKIKFIDYDSLFEGHRFCEPTKTNINDAVGANDGNTWFISLGTTLEESEWVPGDSSEEKMWDQSSLGPIGIGPLQRNSVFHPKEGGHFRAAGEIADVIGKFALENGHTTAGGACTTGQAPRTDCVQLPWGNLDTQIDFGNPGANIACYQNGNRRWCGVTSYGQCQVTIGWDVTNNGGKAPSLSLRQIKAYVDGHINDNPNCLGKSLQTQSDCTQTTPQKCTTNFLYCLTAVGVDCKPGLPV
ncbi:MAG: hypothetical protein M1839_009303 [Geoglossum umbratile]|nr:MAG: hypothetical protein M1839_009303 [Geoglossum umbratile]